MIWNLTVCMAALTVSALLSGCAAPEVPEQKDNEAMLKRMDIAIARLQRIEEATSRTLGKRTVTLRGDIKTMPESLILPSKLLQDSAKAGNASPYNPSLARLLSDAGSGRPIARDYNCAPEEAKDSTDNGSHGEQDLRTARYLDAVVQIQLMPCQRAVQEINNPVASVPTDTNSKAIHAAEFKAQAAALHLPNQVTKADRPTVMLAQAFRFADTNDSKVPVQPYITEQVRAAANEIARLLPPANPQVRRFSFIFDRELTYLPDMLTSKPKGWFNAQTQPDYGIIYMSPTMPRAAMISCVSQVNIQEMHLKRLRTEIRPKLIDRSLTPSDVSASVRNAEVLSDKMDACLKKEMTFLLGHELAHGHGIRSEAQADCVSAAVTMPTGGADYGLFSSLIFEVAHGSDFAMLDVDAAGARELICRERRLKRIDFSIYRSLQARIDSCQPVAEPCNE